MNFNRIVLVGRLTGDPEIKYSGKGTAICKYTLAVNRDFDKDKKADFVNTVCFGKLAEVMVDNLYKGRLILQEGRLQIDNYKNDAGEWKNYTSVIADKIKFLEWPDDKNDKAEVRVAVEEEEDVPF